MFSFSNLFTSSVKKAIPSSVVGIDFGSASIKVVELERRDDIVALRTYGELQLGQYVTKDLGDVVELTQEKKTAALTDVLREAGVEAAAGILALPLNASFVTVMSLTAKEDENIEPRVRVEARKYIPIPLSDVTLDWTELAPLGKEPKTVREVLIAAVQNDSYGQMTNLMQSINKASQPSEIELFSSLRSLSTPSDTSIAVIDLGAQTSKLYIAQDGMLRKIHRVRMGGVQATKRIMELTGVSFTEAENLKRNYATSGKHHDDVKKAVVSTFERPLQEFRRVLAQHEMRLGAPVGKIVLTGGAVAFPEIAPFASYMFDREVTRANPFAKVAYPAFMEDRLTEIAPLFSVAIGAALRPYQDV
jgi:type IV pilus assembly protein PilM